MKLTIITATYNSQDTLAVCLQSVANQTAIEKVEHIIVDGASRDDTLSIVKQFKHVSAVLSAPDRGIYHAFNKGLEIASGQLIVFLGSDDQLFEDDTVEQIIDTILPESDYLSGRVLIEDKINNKSYASLPYNHAQNHFKPVHPGFIATRRLFDKIGPFNECFSIAADMYFMKKAMQLANGQHTSQIIAKFSKGGVSSQAQHRAEVLRQDEAIDTLLGSHTYGATIHERFAIASDTVTQLKQLFLNHLNDEAPPIFRQLQNKKIAIFGTRELSEIVYRVLKSNAIDVICFVVSDSPEGARLGDVPIVSVEQLGGLAIDIVINGVEGKHAIEIEDHLNTKYPNIEVLNWKQCIKA